MLTPMLAKISGAVTWLNDNFDTLKPILAAVATALAVGLVVGLVALGTVIYGTVVPAVTAMNIALLANPIGLIVIALAAVAFAWSKWGDSIKDFLRAVWAKFLGNIGTGLKVLSKFFGIFNSEIADALTSASDSLQETAANMGKVEKATEKLAKEQEATTKVTVKATKQQIKAAKAAKKSAESVQGLVDSWTGATLKSGEFLRAFRKLTPEQKKNDRIMDKVLDKYNSMRKVLGPFNDELEHQWRMTERLNPELAAQRKETEKLDAAAKKLAEKALADLTKEQEKLKKVAEALNDRLENQRLRLLGLPTEAAIQSFDELTRTWEGLNEAEREIATKEYTKALTAAAKSGHELNAAQLALVASTAGLTEEQEKLKKETEDLNERLEKQRLRLLGLPTDEAIQSFKELTITWESMNEAEKAVATEKYRDALLQAAKAGLELNEAQEDLAGSSKSWFSNISGGFKNMLEGITGGEGVSGMLQGIGSGITQGIGNLISGGLASIAQFALKGIVAIGKKISRGAIKSLFGGPSEAELAGRKTAHAFREGVIEGLSAEQMEEVQLSWAEGWDSSVIIAVRDASDRDWGRRPRPHERRGMRCTRRCGEPKRKGRKRSSVCRLEIQAILDAAATAATDAAEAAAAFEAVVIVAALEAALSAARARQDAEMSALKARQDAEMGVLTTQIDAIENRLRPKISEVQALIDQQKSELDRRCPPDRPVRWKHWRPGGRRRSMRCRRARKPRWRRSLRAEKRRSMRLWPCRPSSCRFSKRHNGEELDADQSRRRRRS